MAQRLIIPGVPSTVITTRLPEPLLAALDEYTARVGVNRSVSMRQAVEQMLARETPDLAQTPLVA